MPDIFNSKSKISKTVGKVGGKLSKKKDPTRKKPKIYLPKRPKEKVKRSLSGHSHNPLSAYVYYPDRVSFVSEDPEEEIVLLLRKHPITNLSWMSVAFLMIIAPSFLTVLTPFDFLPLEFQLILTLVWYLITAAFIMEEFLSWFFHVNIITDERIIEVDFVNLVYREITDANIDHIEDVTVQVGSAIRTFFDYGDVSIQTAAEVPKIDFEAVPNPDQVSRVLRELRIQEEQEKLEGRVR